MDEGIELLTKMFQERDWFHSVGTDSSKRYVVYTLFSCEETLRDIPDYMLGRQVLVHFASSKTATAAQFTNVPSTFSIPAFQQAAKAAQAQGIDVGFGQAMSLEDMEELDSSLLERDLTELCKKLDQLEKRCGTNCLQDIFYEIHDGKNAVTNLSAKYPEVRAGLEVLYNEYGFDIMYEEMDG